MSGVVRRPTPAEEIRHDIYGTTYPDPRDLLVELVTARSLHGPTQLSDREITTRLRLRSTDDALRLVKLCQTEGRLLVDQDSNIRRLAIPFAAIVPETADRLTVAAVRAALPPPPAEPVARKAQPAPFVARPTREIGPAAGEIRGTQGHVVIDEYFQPDPIELPPPPETPAQPEEDEAVKPNIVMHINVPRDVHARMKEISLRDGTAMNKIAIDAVVVGLDGPTVVAGTAPAPVEQAAIAPAAPPVVNPACADIDNLRVPIALFRAAQDANMSLRELTEEVIAAGWSHFLRARTEAGR